MEVTKEKIERSESRVLLNKNTSWLSESGAWTFYITLVLLSYCTVCTFVDTGLAWTYTHLAHAVVTYYLLHWNKGSPFQEDQGKYDNLTFWEQLDDGVQYSSNRKFLTAVPVVLFILASHSTDYAHQPLALNLLAVILLVIAKLPVMHKVRVLGINGGYV
uniref:Ormdl-domain-containing protein n=1 Tax=Tetraselmis sp. GSL018 TaxID=582737 RepID=A0A061S7X6_9CHLO|eukprot:CAMPEP_0177601096 /NCGR_PEP_ID=MMETSP0419_2-20121207/14044_1 /TAXON_ID=582737 /ORGANISM="Tetraselmis sp., Strain GSL018" /LENGTH=159 /DNA_ID=CAMNT_0019094273 /DNA_START=110 /DNA_END=589 /DNA_ORIENTATION=-